MLQEKLLRLREKFSFKNFKELNFKKYFKFFPAIIFLIILGLFLPGGSARAFDLVGIIMDYTLFPVLYVVFAILLWVGFIITSIAAYTLNATLNPAIMNQVFANPAIYQGWTIIRNICNLLFLLIMLLVAFGTIVQSNKYNIKNSLTKLILAIFLINFSNVVAGAIIDFGNILMYGILGWMCAIPDSCFSDYMGGLMKVAWNFADSYSLLKLLSWDGINSTQVIGAAVAMVYLFMYGFILLALAAFLMVRTAGLAILLILAPFAYFGDVMPGMEKIASKWWNNIWSYALFGPIFALMLYIAGELAQITIAVPPITDPNLGWYSGIIVIIISNILPLLFLLAIIPVTKELGLAGTDTILKNTTGLGEKIGKYAMGTADRFVARGAGMQGQQGPGAKAWLSRRYAGVRRRASYVSPGAIKRALKATIADQEHDYDVAAGAARNRLDPYGALKDKYGKWKDPNYKSVRPDYEQRAKDAKAELEFKAQGITNVDEMIDETKSMMEKGINPELSMKNFRWIMAEGETDALLERMGFERGAQGLSDLMQKYYDKRSSTGYRNLNDERLSRFSSDISKAEKKNKNINYEGVGKFDTATGGYVFNRMSNATERDVQKADQVKGYNAMEERNRLRGTKGGNYVNRAGAATDTGIEMLRQIKGRDLDQVKGMARKDAQMVHDGLRSRFGAPTFVPATRTMPAHYNFVAGTPNDIKAVWNKIMIDKDIH